MAKISVLAVVPNHWQQLITVTKTRKPAIADNLARCSRKRHRVYLRAARPLLVLSSASAVLDPKIDHTMNEDFCLPLCYPQHMLQRHPSPCYPSRSCVVFLSCVLLTMSRAWYLYSDSCVVSSRCGNNYVNFLDFTLFNSSLSTPALFRTRSFVFFAVQDTRSNYRKTFTSKALNRFSSFILSVQLSHYVANGHKIAFINLTFKPIYTKKTFANIL